MAKKENQWLIDRAFNFDSSNEAKIMSVLKNIYKFNNGEISYVDAVNNMVRESATPSFDRYERSTQTLFKSYGLELAKDEVTPISIAFVNGIINFKELALLQCFKKQFMDNRSHMVRPLMVALIFLFKAYQNESLRKYSWIDVYDYMNYLTEVKEYKEINSLFDSFIKDKNLSSEDRMIEEIKDCDIWYNFFVTTGLFIKDANTKYKIYLNVDELDLITYLINNHEKATLIDNNQNWLSKFGSTDLGIPEILPTLNVTSKVPNVNIDDSIIDDVLHYVLVNGLSVNECDDRVLLKIGNDFVTKGLLSTHILNSFNLPNSKENNKRGIYKPFKNYLGILNFVSDYVTIKNIIERLIKTKQDKYLFEIERNKGGKNIIYYGTPGCGKSHLVDEIYNNGINKIYRTVFHPEYSNSDFVGQIIPKVSKDDNKTVVYEFMPGLFTQSLKFAIKNPTINVYLIIEEINRGNASAIFGEIFQLLDRDQNGTSVYSIKNSNISEELGEYDDFDIKLPSNLYLIATMNTSDQNVYTLDTAFKRRWELKKIRNTFVDVDGDDERKITPNLLYKFKLANLYVPGTSTKWKDFVKCINNKISSKGKTFSIISEDKELGVFFVTPNFLSDIPQNKDIDLIRKFAEKVLMYLWNDIAKTDPDKWFVFEEGQSKTLDNLLDNFEKKATDDSLKVFATGIFEPKID